MPFIQNISDEAQLVRVQGTKSILKPGEIAEVLESETAITKSYKRLFAELKTADGVQNPATTDTPPAIVDPYDGLKQAELKQLAEDRKIDIAGVKSNAGIIEKLKEADAQEALAKEVVDESIQNPATTDTPPGETGDTTLPPQA